MKKYLMTWYGITDLRASLELEDTAGPVLAALLNEDYTDVVILGFTKTDNAPPEKAEEIKQLRQNFSETKTISPGAATEFLRLFANTDEAHTHFCRWLDKRLQDADNRVVSQFHAVTLRHLNDTEGIYEAATRAMDAVAAEEGEKRVTLYLSPGTPVMAFVWAFASLRHPNLKKRLIASSRPEKPPEEILLPNEWMEWHGRQIRAEEPCADHYDAVFHLFGEQRIPNLLGVIQFPSRKHIFVYSENFPPDIMKPFLGEAEYGDTAVDPYDPESVRTRILDQAAQMPANSRIAFNLTGGTKLMYAGALAACRKINATPFYFNGRNYTVVNLNDFTTTATNPIPSVETFIRLNTNNLVISKPGHWNDIPGIQSPERKALTLELWNERRKITGLYRQLQDYNDNCNPFELRKGNICAKLSRENIAEINIGNKHFAFEKWPDFARYLSGGWFEEYTFIKLQPLCEAGVIKDLRIGLEVSFKEPALASGMSGLGEQFSALFGDLYQELDIAFTDGRRLYIVECKAGNVISEHVMKLQNIIRYFGGVEGRALLVSCFTPSSNVVKKKISDSGNIQSLSGDSLSRELARIVRTGVDK